MVGQAQQDGLRGAEGWLACDGPRRLRTLDAQGVDAGPLPKPSAPTGSRCS